MKNIRLIALAALMMLGATMQVPQRRQEAVE